MAFLFRRKAPHYKGKSQSDKVTAMKQITNKEYEEWQKCFSISRTAACAGAAEAGGKTDRLSG